MSAAHFPAIALGFGQTWDQNAEKLNIYQLSFVGITKSELRNVSFLIKSGYRVKEGAGIWCPVGFLPYLHPSLLLVGLNVGYGLFISSPNNP